MRSIGSVRRRGDYLPHRLGAYISYGKYAGHVSAAGLVCNDISSRIQFYLAVENGCIRYPADGHKNTIAGQLAPFAGLYIFQLNACKVFLLSKACNPAVLQDLHPLLVQRFAIDRRSAELGTAMDEIDLGTQL